MADTFTMFGKVYLVGATGPYDGFGLGDWAEDEPLWLGWLPPQDGCCAECLEQAEVEAIRGAMGAGDS